MDTSIDLSILPCEVRQYIWSYCDKPSLKVLSVCCKQMYAEVKPFVWKRVEVSWQFLQGITKELVKNPHPNLQLISCLVLGAENRSAWQPSRKVRGSFWLLTLLERCEQLKSLTMCNFLPTDGPRLVSEILPQLQNLELKNIKLRDGDLKPLVGLLELKSLTLDHCSIKKSDWNVIWQLESLEHLTLTHASPLDSEDLIPGGGFCLKNLRSFKFSGESRELYSCIATISVKLVSLDLTWSGIQDSDILNLSCLKGLKYLSLFGADEITDLGISHLTNLTCLEQLTLGDCELLSPQCLLDIGKIQTLTSLDLFNCPEETTDISCLSNLQNLHALNISGMPGLTDDALKVAAQLKHLRKLMIRCYDPDDNKFTEEGIRHLYSASTSQNGGR